MKNRAELAKLFKGHGVELGVAAGLYSETILERSKCLKLWSIDRWSDHHDLKEYAAAVSRLSSSGKGRSEVLRMTFEEAASLFPDNSLDFVYVDGYAHTGQDGGKTLDLWWPKLRQNGIFAGHDYHPKYKATQATVDAFCASHSLALNKTDDPENPEADQFPSWWVRKGALAHRPVWRQGCPVPLGAKVILVGNGPSVLREDKGPLIDSFDQVIRFNTYAIKGFEKHTGTRTTLWSTFGRGSRPRDLGELPPAALYIHGEAAKEFDIPVAEAWGIPRSFFDKVLENLRAVSVRDEERKKPLLPSSGLVVVSWLLENGVEQVTLTGFDHFSKAKTGMHHYWINRSFSEPPEHDGAAEAKVFAQWASEKRITYI